MIMPFVMFHDVFMTNDTIWKGFEWYADPEIDSGNQLDLLKPVGYNAAI